MFRKTLLPAAMIILAGGLTATAASGTAAAATAPACPAPAVIEILHFAFKPPTVTAGQSSTVTLTAQNCTDQAQVTFVSLSAQFTGPGTGILPPGCYVIDPLGWTVSFPPNTIFSVSLSYPTFSACTATRLIATAGISGDNGPLAQKTATLAIAAAPASAGTARQRWSSSPAPRTQRRPVPSTTATVPPDATHQHRRPADFPPGEAITLRDRRR